MYDSGNTTIFHFENDHLTSSQTSNTITVSGLGVAPSHGSCGIGTQFLGFAVATAVSF